jgi:acyl dehydratase
VTLDAFFRIGTTVTLGSHTFEAEAIKAFARKYDPQVFHIDEEAAKKSVLGGLCASGWHTAATWMKLNLEARMDGGEALGPALAPCLNSAPRRASRTSNG